VPHGRANAILLPHVIRYNGTQPSKPAVWPKYNFYCANERYAALARMLGLPASTIEEGVESYAKACDDLARSLGIKMSLAEQKIDLEDFNQNIESVAMLAYEDQCSPCNPRQPLVKEMMEILRLAYNA